MRISVIIAFPKEQVSYNIKNVLKRLGYETDRICTGAAELRAEAEKLGGGIIICSYRFRDGMAEDVFADLAPMYQMLVIGPEDALSMRQSSGMFLLTTPLKTDALLATVSTMCMAYRQYQKYVPHRKKPRRAEDQKLLDDAKHLLMERNRMSEAEAHRYMQKCSMDTGTDILEVAEKILMLG